MVAPWIVGGDSCALVEHSPPDITRGRLRCRRAKSRDTHSLGTGGRGAIRFDRCGTARLRRNPNRLDSGKRRARSGPGFRHATSIFMPRSLIKALLSGKSCATWRRLATLSVLQKIVDSAPRFGPADPGEVPRLGNSSQIAAPVLLANYGYAAAATVVIHRLLDLSPVRRMNPGREPISPITRQSRSLQTDPIAAPRATTWPSHQSRVPPKSLPVKQSALRVDGGRQGHRQCQCQAWLAASLSGGGRSSAIERRFPQRWGLHATKAI